MATQFYVLAIESESKTIFQCWIKSFPPAINTIKYRNAKIQKNPTRERTLLRHSSYSGSNTRGIQNKHSKIAQTIKRTKYVCKAPPDKQPPEKKRKTVKFIPFLCQSTSCLFIYWYGIMNRQQRRVNGRTFSFACFSYMFPFNSFVRQRLDIGLVRRVCECCVDGYPQVPAAWQRESPSHPHSNLVADVVLGDLGKGFFGRIL